MLIPSLVVALASCAHTPPQASPSPSPRDAAAFVARVNTDLRAVLITEAEAAWAYQTDLTDAHEAALVEASTAAEAFRATLVPEAAALRQVDGLDPDVARKLERLRIYPTLPAPNEAAKRQELVEISTKLNRTYSTGSYCEGDVCRELDDARQLMAESRDYDVQLAAWQGWRTISPPMRPQYARLVELANEGAQGLGFKHVAELWQSKYDMPPDGFAAEVERLWSQVAPLYEKLHCHVRAELSDTYGAERVDPTGKLPAHLFGNMWSQSWDALYPTLVPFPDEPALNVDAKLADWEPQQMVRTGEAFFTSLGLDPLPETFWERSMFVDPDDRDVVCHASAWDVHINGDVRLKMCIRPVEEDFVTIHHELGHNYYDWYYRTQHILYQDGAHDGFHEGIGDTLALSITPRYLRDNGLLDSVSTSDEAQINDLMKVALDKVAFLPFGLLIDKWRWGVFSGEIPPEQYNEAWWALREQYQGITPPVPRSEADFDPGAKYHIPANTPYMRYFLANILQFQFHAALCDAAGHEGPLHTCSIYGSPEAGERLVGMLSLGASQPWPDALEAITGTREMDANALRSYFAPLEGWLDEQNQGRTCGW